MFDSTVYNEGSLIVGKMSGVLEPQSFINGIFCNDVMNNDSALNT